MKKILLGTSALIGAATLLAGAAYADDPKVTIGGFSTFEAGLIQNDYNNNSGGVNHAGTSQTNRAFRNDNEIHFNIAGKTDQGLGYGAEIDLEADIDGSPAGNASTGTGIGSSNQGITAHRTYGWLQGDQWGHFEFGSNDGAARTLKVDASNIARASGGIDGDWVYFAQTNTYTGSGNIGAFAGGRSFITAPRLPIEAGPATTFYSDTWGNDTKVTYYTPRFAGFQLGASYAPNAADRGQSTLTVASPLNPTDVFSGGINYENQFDQIGVAAAVTGETANVQNNVTGTGGGANGTGPFANDIRAWNAGAKLTWMGLSLAGSYGSWDDSLVSGGTSDYWTAGLAYETGPLGASVTYMGSATKPAGQDNKFEDISAGVDYKLAPGLTPFIEYTYYQLDPTGGTAFGANPGAVAKQNGGVALIGTQLSF